MIVARTETTSSSQSQPHLAHAALNVVLAYWMIPNLGWSTDMYETKLLTIRDAIIADKLRYESGLDKFQVEQMRKQLYKHYEQEFLYSDTVHFQLLQEELEQKNIEAHMSNLQTVQDEEEDEDSPYYNANDVNKIICDLYDNYLQPKIWMAQHQLISAVFHLRKSYLQLRYSINQLFKSQQHRWNNMNTLISYLLVEWDTMTRRLHLMEAALFDFTLLPLSFESELDSEKMDVTLDEATVAHEEARDALNKAKTNCMGNKFCDQESILKVVQEFEAVIGIYDIQTNRLNRWRDCTPCAKCWMYEPKSLSKATAQSWTKCFVSLLSSITTCQNDMESPRIRQTDDLQTLMKDCELFVMSDIYNKLHTICYGLQDREIYLLHHLMDLSTTLHEIINDNLNSPSSSSLVISKIAYDSLDCVSQSLGMKNHWIGLYVGQISSQSYLHHQLATIMLAVAAKGKSICPYRYNFSPITKTMKQFYFKFYAFGETLCQELQNHITLQIKDEMESHSDFREYALYIAEFKPVLQIYYGEDRRQMQHHYKSYIILSLTKLTFSLARCNSNSNKPEGILLLDILSKIYKECSHNNFHDVTFELLVYQQLLNISNGLIFTDSNAKEDLPTLSALWDQWIKLYSSECKNAIITSLLRQLLKIQLFIRLLEYKIYRKGEAVTLQYGDSGKWVPQFKANPQRITNNAPCDQLYDKLQKTLSVLDTNSLNCPGINFNMLVTYLFWMEKTLEVQMMRYELITPIDGVLEEKYVKLSETFLDAQLASIEWIEEVGMHVSAMSSIFKLEFSDKEVTENDAVTWLLSESTISFSSNCGPEHQIRATQCMKEVALKWKAEYTIIVNAAIEKESLTKHTVQSLPSVFSMFCR